MYVVEPFLFKNSEDKVYFPVQGAHSAYITKKVGKVMSRCPIPSELSAALLLLQSISWATWSKPRAFLQVASSMRQPLRRSLTHPGGNLPQQLRARVSRVLWPPKSQRKSLEEEGNPKHPRLSSLWSLSKRRSLQVRS